MLLHWLLNVNWVLIGGPIVLDGGMAVGDLSAFLTYVTQILSSLVMISFLLMFSSRALASAKRISEVLEEKTDIDDSYASCKDAVVTKGEIEFKSFLPLGISLAIAFAAIMGLILHNKSNDNRKSSNDTVISEYLNGVKKSLLAWIDTIEKYYDSRVCDIKKGLNE